MASDERDRNFDKAIARHLRSAAPSADSANAAADSLAQRNFCADAETLAAYHERSLLPEELNSWKEHIVGCAHCQELLAHLELTDDIPLHAAENEKVFASSASRPIEATLELAAPRKDSRPARLAGLRWRWLAPASALAAGVLVWIAMHENRPQSFPMHDEVKVAKQQEPAPPPVFTPAPAVPPAAKAIPSNSRATSDQISAYSGGVASGNREDRPVDRLRASGALAKASADKESAGLKDAGRGGSAGLSAEEKQLDLDSKIVGGAVQPKNEMQAQTRKQEQNAQLQNQNNAYSAKVAGPAPLGQMESSKKMKSASAPPPAAPALEDKRDYSVGAMSQTVEVASDPNLISAPGSSFLWHTGRSGLIEYSQNGGRSWVRQSSGVLVDLSRGSAPSEKVCWIIGRSGAILLTTDGGDHWKLLSSLLKEDIDGIHATDALHATIWNNRTMKFYATVDGGLTWNPIGKP